MSFAAVLTRLQTLENPYPGLRPFESAESHLFFGRDQQVAEVIERLERNRLLAVLGVSGSGKSSLVRAGLIPALERGSVMNPGRRWRIAVMRPAGSPFESLAAALANIGLDPSVLRESSHGLIRIARQLSADERLLVIVDQFEEIFRYKDIAPVTEAARFQVAVAAADAAEFARLLMTSGGSHPPVYIVLTMRSDYLGDCAEFRDLPEALNDGQYLLPRLTRDERKEAIERPLAGVPIAPNLVQRLLNDAGDEPDQLPVLQHALMRTWAHWRTTDPDRKRRIDQSDYQAIGGFGDALNQHANELLAGVPLDIAATIFKRLTARGRGRRERRDPATLAELWAVCGADTPERQAQVTAVVERFRRGEATFLSPRERDGAIGPDTFIDITHETLIRQWTRLRDEWLPEEERSAKAFLDLAEWARQWSRKEAELLTGADLDWAIKWREQRNPSTAWAEHYADSADLTRVLEFIGASEQHQRDAQAAKAKERRRLRMAVGIAIVAIVAGLGAVAVNQYFATRAALVAEARARILSARSVRDPLIRALLLKELGNAATDDHLAVYQQAASTAIPFAVRRFTANSEAKAIGFPSGDRVAVVFEDGTMASWRRDGRGDLDMRVIAELPRQDDASRTGTGSWITSATFSPDGQWLAIGLCNAQVWIQRVGGAAGARPASAGPSGTSLADARYKAPADTACPDDAARVTALAFSRDGRRLAAGDARSVTRVWRLDGVNEGLPAGVPIALGGDQNGAISSVAFDSAGERVATGSRDGACRIYARDGASNRQFMLGGRDVVMSAVFSPHDDWLLCAYKSGVVRMWRAVQDGAAADVDLVEQTAGLTAVAFSPDESKIAIASGDRTARVWMVQSERPSESSPSGSNPPESNSSASNPSANNPSVIKAANVRTIASPRALAHDAAVTGMVFSRDGRTLVTTADDGTIRTWATDQGEPRILGMHSSAVESVAFDREGRRVASGSDDSTARIWPVDGPAPAGCCAGHTNWVRGVTFNPATSQELLTASDDNTVRIWDASGSGRMRVASESDKVFAASFDPRGTRVVTAVADGTARVWKLSQLRDDGGWYEGLVKEASDKQPIELRHKEWVNSAAFSRDGSKIVTASRDGAVRIWAADRSAEQPERELRNRTRAVVFSAAFSPDGSYVAAGSDDGMARIWPLNGSSDPIELRHLNDVRKVAFNSTGGAVLTASLDGTARVWSRAGVEQLMLDHGGEPVMAAAFDPSDARIVTGTREGVIRLWHVTLPALRTYLEQATTACLTPPMRVQYLGEPDAQARSRYAECESNYDRSPAAVKK